MININLKNSRMYKDVDVATSVSCDQSPIFKGLNRLGFNRLAS